MKERAHPVEVAAADPAEAVRAIARGTARERRGAGHACRQPAVLGRIRYIAPSLEHAAEAVRRHHDDARGEHRREKAPEKSAARDQARDLRHEEDRKHREQDSQRAAESRPHEPTQAVDEADREADRGGDREEPAFARERAVDRGADAGAETEDDEAADRDLAAQPTIQRGRVPREGARTQVPRAACEERRHDAGDEKRDRSGDPGA